MNITAVQPDSVWENKQASFAKVRQLAATPRANRGLCSRRHSPRASTNTAVMAGRRRVRGFS
jgi:hypothetical protein